MRRRLTLTIVGLVTGALLLAGGGALLVASSSARDNAAVQLLAEAEAFARNASAIHTPRMLRAVARVLRLDRAEIVVVDRAGRAVSVAPATLGTRRLLPLASSDGPRSGVAGNLAYAIVPVQLDHSVAGAVPEGDSTAVLFTRRVGALAPDWGFFVAVTAATVAIAAVVGAGVGRRMSKPVSAASEVTGRIAAGELDARLPVSDRRRDELDSLARSINAMAASLEDARRRETELLASISHDLRTPLTSIRGYAEAITDDVTEDARHAARIITDQAHRLERLVGDLLDLAKARAHHLALHPVAVDLVEATAAAVEAVRPEARRLGVAVVHRGAEAPTVAAADPDRLGQVLGNLVHNAVAYAASTVVVEVGGVASGRSGWVSVSVADDGPGIPADELGRVFDRFHQVDRGRAGVGGSGLGLAIVAELVSAMGGTVVVESPASADPAHPGSRFVVCLPSATRRAL